MELNSVSNTNTNKSLKTSLDNNRDRVITPDSSPTKQRKNNDTGKSPIRKNEKSSKKRIKWSKTIADIVDVVSYKKYNLENCHDDPNIIKDKTRCSCTIF